MKRLLAIFTAKHQPDRDALSAYLDGQLAAGRAAALEAHVASCAACTETLEGMREVRAMLRALPEAEPPRSFRLRASDVEAPGRARAIAAPPPSLMRAMPVLSAAAVVVFAVAVAFDAAGNGSDNDRNAGLAMQQESAAYANDSTGAARNSETLPNGGPPAADEAPGGGAEGATPVDGALGAAPQPNAPVGTPPASPAGDAFQPDVEVASAADDDDGNNLTLRIVEVAAAAIAIVAGGLALRTWRKRREGVA